MPAYPELTVRENLEVLRRLRPGTPVQVTGLLDRLAGRYVLTSVTHTIDSRRGFVSELSSVPPPARERARGAVAVLGEVTRDRDTVRAYMTAAMARSRRETGAIFWLMQDSLAQNKSEELLRYADILLQLVD